MPRIESLVCSALCESLLLPPSRQEQSGACHPLQVKNGKTFLDLIAEQVKHTRQKFGEALLLQLQLLAVYSNRASTLALHSPHKPHVQRQSASSALVGWVLFLPHPSLLPPSPQAPRCALC